jgi:hypothetical protein
LAAGQGHKLRLAHIDKSTEARAGRLSWVGKDKTLARLNANSTARERNGWESLDVEVATLRA